MNVGLPVRMLLCFYLITACFLVWPRMCETTEDILSLSGSWPGSEEVSHGVAASEWNCLCFGLKPGGGRRASCPEA